MQSLRTRLIRAATACLTVLVVSASTARADVDVEVRNGDKVLGTINPVNEVEVLRYRIPEGATVSASAVGRRAGRREPTPTVTFEVQDEFGDPVDLGSAVFSPRGRGARLTKWVVEETAVYRIVITAVGEDGGNYLARVSWRNRSRFGLRGHTFNDGPPEAEFAADKGSIVIASIGAKGASKAKPRLLGVEGLDNDFFGDFPELPDRVFETARGQRGKVTLTETGLFLLTTDDFSFDGGPVAGSVRIIARRSKRMVDLSGRRIGANGEGGDVARGRVVGPEGALDGDEVLFALEGEGGVFGGAGISIPEGALGVPTAILIGTAPDIDPGEGNQGGGPTVFFGPEGQKFAQGNPVTITIPYNPNAFEDIDDIRVFTKNAKGVVTEIDAELLEIDPIAGTVSFQVAHFSSFRVVAPAVPVAVRGDVTGDGVPDLLVPGGITLADLDPGVFVFAGGTGLLSATSSDDADLRISDDLDPGSNFGTSFTTGDVDGDGEEDVIVSDDLSGQAFVFFGGSGITSTNTTSAPIVLSSDLDGMGISIAAADVDDDGVADVIAGAPEGGLPEGFTLPGVAYVFGGSRNVRDELPVEFTSDSDRVRVIGGVDDVDQFGTAVAVGDVTGDGRADLLVSAPRSDDLRETPAEGSVYVLSGGAALDDRDLTVDPARIILRGEHPDDGFGSSMTVADVNHDGVNDIIVGAPGVDDLALTDPGAVFVFFGGRELTGELTVADADRRYLGLAGGDVFGTHVAAADVNGDGFDDVIVGATGVDLPGPLVNVGEVYVFLGGDGKRGRPALAPSGSASQAPLRIVGETEGGAFGVLLRPLDVDGIAGDDLIVAAPFFETGLGIDQGRVYLFSGGAALSSGSLTGADADVILTGVDDQRLGGPLEPQLEEEF